MSAASIKPSRKSLFAELLAKGLDIPEIRHELGMTNNSAQSTMARIRKDLGWQAR